MEKLPNLGIFKKVKKQGHIEPVKPAEPTARSRVSEEEPPNPSVESSKESAGKIYLRAMPLRELSDLEVIRKEVRDGRILILRITPLASKSIEGVKQAVGELYDFAEAIGGDIARLGEERVVICPPAVRIWRKRNLIQNEPMPTAA